MSVILSTPNSYLEATTQLQIASANPSLSSCVITDKLGVGTLNPQYPVHIVGDVMIYGHITAVSGATFQNTQFTTTSALSIINTGTGPALIVSQEGDQGIVAFYDHESTISLWADGHIDRPGYVGIKTNKPNRELTVMGRISSTGDIQTSTKFIGDLQGNAATVTNGVYTNQTYNNPSWLNSLSFNKLTGVPAYLPLSGGTLTGRLSGTTASFSSGVSSNSFYGISATFINSLSVTGNTILKSITANNFTIVKTVTSSSGDPENPTITTTITTPLIIDNSGNLTVSGKTSLSSSTVSGSTTNALIQIIQTGIGNSFMVSDQSNDTTPFLIDNVGHVIIGGTTSSSNIELTVYGDISAQNIIYASIGNSTDWNNSYTLINANSGKWNTVYTTVTSNSAKWNTVYTTITSNSANWNNSYTTVNTNSGKWNTVYTTVNSNSSVWDNTHTTVNTNSATWGTTVSVSGYSTSPANSTQTYNCASNNRVFTHPLSSILARSYTANFVNLGLNNEESTTIKIILSGSNTTAYTFSIGTIDGDTPTSRSASISSFPTKINLITLTLIRSSNGLYYVYSNIDDVS